MSKILNFDDTAPAADAGYALIKWKRSATPDGVDPSTGYSYYDLSGSFPNSGGVSAKTANYTAVAADNGTLLSFNSASAVALTLPATPPFANWRIAVQNIGAGALTVNRNGLTIDGAASNLTLAQNSGCWIFSDGTNYFTERGAGSVAIVSTAGLVIDGAGSVPATGAKGFVQVPFAGTITGWTLLADVSGAAQITVSKGAYAAYPTVSSIVASAPPALSSAQKNTSTTLTGWTTAVAAGDILTFNLDSVSTCTRLVLELQITRS